MKKLSKLMYVRTLTVLVLFGMTIVGSDCEDILTPQNPNTNCSGSNVSVVGTWRFTQNLGGTRDVCLGEVVVFNANGTATLTCPNQAGISRTYTISSDFVLTYNETGMQYCLSGDSDELQMTGKNNNRILYYVKTASDSKSGSNQTFSGNNIILKNSSELK
jgi:hypothetical protein